MLSFVNSSKRPVILLQPSRDIEYDLGGIALALEKESANSGLYVYNTSAFRSVSTGPEYRQLATRLDTQSPQPEVTRIIPAGETWELKVSARFSFNDENVCSLSVSNGIEIGWRAIRQLPSPLWLRLTLEVWPFNVENFKKDLGSKLRKRWKKYGDFIGQREDRYWHAIIVSEPIQLDLRGHI